MSVDTKTTTSDRIIDGNTFRKCSKCSNHKIISEYPKASWCEGGHRKTCSNCALKVRQVSRSKYKAKNPHYRQANTLRYKYGITLQEYLDLVKIQYNKCAICNQEEKTKGKTLSVDHCHKTGKIRGLLCHRCNAGIGFLQDDVEVMKAAILYIKESLK